jgi:hypothetical protein
VRPRLHSYALMLGGALAGGVFGAAFDQVTVSVSPAYFLVGKGLSVEAGGLRGAAAWTGFRGGLAVGAWVVGSALWLEDRGAAWDRRRYAASVLVTAVVASFVGAALMSCIDPLGVRLDSAGVLDDAEASAYLAVWGGHVGVYFGSVLAPVVWAVRRSR